MGYDPPGYQSYDKAMDVYYLAIAYLATLRNWASDDAFVVSRFLYYYRLVGVVLFELLNTRALLLIFPNTFEYFFITYEAVRSRWNPRRFALRWWVIAAALIWIFVKLPQEYWIHIAQRDVTETLAADPWLIPVLVVLAAVVAAVLWYVVRPRLPAADWTWRFPADPLPAAIDSAAEQAAWRADQGRVFSVVTLEKVVLLGLLSVIFAQTLPGVRSSNFQLFVGIAAVVVLNAAVVLWAARRGRSVESLALAFLIRLGLNTGLVVLGSWLLGREGGDLNLSGAFFFMLLISLLTTLHDRYQPIRAYRVRTEPQTTDV